MDNSLREKVNIRERLPKTWETYNDQIDKYFPKGDNRRGDVLVLVAMILATLNDELTALFESESQKAVRDFAEEVKRHMVVKVEHLGNWKIVGMDTETVTKKNQESIDRILEEYLKSHPDKEERED